MKGKLPEGWKVNAIDKIATVTSGGTPDRKEKAFWGNEIPWVTTSEIQFSTIYYTTEKITALGLKHSSAKLFPVNTILIAMYGQGKTRGKVAKLGIEAATNQACAAVILKSCYDVDFYLQFLMSQYNHIREMSNCGSQENLSAALVKSILVPIPPRTKENRGNFMHLG
jgi:type I restriction enzyme S subunit